MTTDTDKIENCPFCGNHAEFRHGAIHGESWGELRRVLWCSSSHCRAQMSLPYHYANADAVLIKSWNCRSLSVELTEWKIRCAELEQNAAHIQSSDEAEDLKRALTDCSVELTELRQAKESRPALPQIQTEGKEMTQYKLIAREPTDEMLRAIDEMEDYTHVAGFQAMFDAAPDIKTEVEKKAQALNWLIENCPRAIQNMLDTFPHPVLASHRQILTIRALLAEWRNHGT